MKQIQRRFDAFMPIEPVAGDEIVADIRALRKKVIDAWQSRAVLLTPDERRALREEIRETCSLIIELTTTD